MPVIESPKVDPFRLDPAAPSRVSGERSKFCVVLGAQWGDEGKGKLVDILAQEAQLCARFNGGANAGHTLIVEGKKYAFHLLPCGIINKGCRNLIGNGVVVHVPTLMRELDALREFDSRAIERVFISTRSHILFDSHQIIDGILEAEQGTNSIGTTKRGIGPCYSSKSIRNGLRFGDLLHFDQFEQRLRELISWSQKRFGEARDKDSPEQLVLRQALREYNTKHAFDPVNGAKGGVSNIEEEIERYRKYAEILRTQIVDSVTLIHEDISRGYKILVEGANAALLDIDFGTYPFVTSSSTTIGGVCTGLGVPPRAIDNVIGVVKAYTTRVGHGPFPTELQNEGQDLDDYMEEYFGPEQELKRPGHTKGSYVLKPGSQCKVGEMLQEVGHEYGTTTGRRRRCGWLDIALVKYSALVNGFDSLNITKLDVLTGLKNIRIAIAYRNQRMTEVRLPRGYFPSHLEDLKEVVCEYETLPGWQEDISQCTSWEALPVNAKKYVLRIQELSDIPVSWVGVGPDRESMLKVNVPMQSEIDAAGYIAGSELPRGSPGSPYSSSRHHKAQV
jgi:adenylosuccinate synthase